MTNGKHWYLGIDSGFGETGLVMLDWHLKVRAFATATCKPRGKSDVARACSLGGHIVDLVRQWVLDYNIRNLTIGMELPVLTKNPVNYSKQVRLVQEIESGLLMTVAGLIEPGPCTLLEFGPSTSKRAATGDGSADKLQVINTSPFALAVMPEKLANNTREALADAWAHAITAVQATRNNIVVSEIVRLDQEFAAIVDTLIYREDSSNE
jgi:Holliday junction resolvasome RuvABC endonuclease subunit